MPTELEILLPNGQVLAAQVYIKDPVLGPIPWDGSITVAPVTGGATSANQVLEIAALDSIDSKLVDHPLTDTELRASAIPIAGIVAVSNFPGTQPVSIAILPNPSNLDVALSTRTKPSDQQHSILDSGVLTSITNPVAVTGPLTDTQIRATALPVSGPLTDTQLRATPVPISGTIATGGLTDTQLRASAVPVSLATAPTTPVTNANLDSPLSTKASALKQDTGNTSLASIDSKLTSPLTVQATNLDTRDLAFATDKVDASGSIVQPLPLTYLSGTRSNLNALNTFAEIDVEGFNGCSFVIEAGTLLASVVCAITFNGIDYFDFAAFSSGQTKYNTKIITPATRVVIQPILVQGVKKVRLTAITYTSGSAFATGYSNTLSDVFGSSLTAQTRGVAPNVTLVSQVGGLDENGLIEELKFCSTTPELTEAGVVVREASGNLATIAAEIGTIDANPSVFSVLDRLKRIEAAINTNTKLTASDASLKNIATILTGVKPLPASLPLYSMRGIR